MIREDLILSKLEWARMGESERQVRDAAVVLEKFQHKLDHDNIEKWINELDLTSHWSQARRLAALE